MTTLQQRLAVLTALLVWALPGFADQVEGRVTQLGAGARVHIELPAGVAVAPGDAVTLLADIPGLGPTAIATRWRVESFSGGIAVAAPQAPPTGAPQLGYVARIETEATAATGAPAPASPDAAALFDEARPLVQSDNPADHASAAGLLRRAADMGHGGAMSALGALHGFGRGVARDAGLAIEWHERAAGLGEATAMLRLGLIYMEAARPEAAVPWFRQAAGHGNAQAMYILALLHEDGTGVDASLVKSVQWLEKAAAAGHAEAMYTLGEIYRDGEDGIIPADPGRAEAYWLQAAELGHGGAMRALAEFYEPRDAVASDRWSAAAQGATPRPEQIDDPRCLSSWECYVAGGQAGPAPGLAAQDAAPPPPPSTPAPRVTFDVQDCDRVAAAPLDPDRPEPDLGIAYRDLDANRAISACEADIARWPDTARFHAQLARGYHKVGRSADSFTAATRGADLGSSQAMALVAVFYYKGEHVPKDLGKALEWFEKSAAAGNVVAMHFAASIRLDPDSGQYNARAAADWYQAAADQGNGEAMAELGILYDNGQGVAYDPDEAAANLMAGLAMGADKARAVLLDNPGQLSPHTRVAVQRILRADGLYSGALDGDIGPRTKRALRARLPD